MDGEQFYNYYNLQDYLSKKQLNQRDLRYIKDLVNTKVAMFNYENLPNDLTSEIIEMALMFNNRLCFYNDKNLGGLILCRYIYGGEFNYYWKPTKVNLIALNGKTIKYNVPYKDIILVRDNEMDIIPYLCIDEYIGKITNIERTMEVNLIVSRLPIMFKCDKKQVSSINNYWKKVANYEPFVIGDSNLMNTEKEDIKLTINTNELYELKDKYKNECLASLGIYASDKKRERLITQEIQAQNDYVDFIYQSMLNERKMFVDKINALGYNVNIVETYETNRIDDMEFEAQKTEKIAIAENVGEERKESNKNDK